MNERNRDESGLMLVFRQNESSCLRNIKMHVGILFDLNPYNNQSSLSGTKSLHSTFGESNREN
jgi:hypothetical protein